jgi:hypothetical protein
MSAKQKAHIRAALRKQIRKNPGAIKRKSFLKKAALVNFKLPVTLRLRGANVDPAGPGVDEPNCTAFTVSNCTPTSGVTPGASNPNKATVDLGPSLGKREVDLGGKLAAEITFHDSFDGGALGNVTLDIRPSTSKFLSSTSIPLLWNTQVTKPTSHNEASDLYQDSLAGCGNFSNEPTAPASPFVSPVEPTVVSLPNIAFASNFLPALGGLGLMGYPVSQTPGGSVVGFLPINPGINDVLDNAVRPRTGTRPGNDDIVGGAVNPFPTGTGPGGFNPTAADTVLRTNALKLTVATPGSVNQSNSTNGPQGSQDIVVGKSGGEANLFGNIPGKSYGIDVTVSLATRINSIIRVVDQDAFHTGVYTGLKWPAGLFNCQQVWTGGVDNYIPGVRLVGNLKISPGITSDGHLRIAKATVNSPAATDPQYLPTRFAVAACLMPYDTYATSNQSNATVPDPLTGPIPYPGGLASTTLLPVDSTTKQGAPSANCNAPPTGLVANSALSGSNVAALGAATDPAFSTTANGSRVSVGADLNVDNVQLDVLIGDV